MVNPSYWTVETVHTVVAVCYHWDIVAWNEYLVVYREQTEGECLG